MSRKNYVEKKNRFSAPALNELYAAMLAHYAVTADPTRVRDPDRKGTVENSVEDWGKLLHDNAASSAILDRLLHRGNLIKFEGKSYRLKEASIRLTENSRKSSG